MKKENIKIEWSMVKVSPKNILIPNLSFIEFSLLNFRDQINDETLSLRKNRHKKDLFSRRSAYINDRSRHLVNPFKLKGIPEKILEKFRISDRDLDNTIQKTLEYLSSKELNDIKFGAFLLRIYFTKLIEIELKLNEKNSKLVYYLDPFIDKGTIPIIGKVLITESNIDILSELTWAMVNMTNFETKKNGYEYIKEFATPIYLEIYSKLIKIEDNEIIINLYEFLINCLLGNDDFGKIIFADENFMRLCIKKYLEPVKSIKEEQNTKKAGICFFASLSKLGGIFNEKQKTTFYKIYEKLIGIMQFDSEVMTNAITGLNSIFASDNSKEKIIFNIIKKYNYNIFDKLFLSLNEIIQKDINFEKIDILIYNISSIVKQFINLSEEKDVIILLQNTQLLHFIEAFYQKIYLKSVKIGLLEILVLISSHSSNVVNNMVKGNENLMINVVKEILNSNNFDIKMKGIVIVYNMLSLNSLDINVELFRTGIIDQIISVNLISEEEPKCLNYILNGILYFINSIKSIENQWAIEIINNLIKIGITNGLESNTTRFNEEHNIIINQIKNDMYNILNNNNSSENKMNNSSTNVFGMMMNSKQINNNTNNNPFSNCDNEVDMKSNIAFSGNNENSQNNI